LSAASGGELCFQAGIVGTPVAGQYVGVSSSGGGSRTIVTSLPIDVLNNDISGYAPVDTLLYRALNFFGGIALSIYDGTPFVQLPQSFDLGQNYPNPFNPTTTIQYTLFGSEAGKAPPRTRLVIFNALGQRVKTLVDEVQTPGTYTVMWDGTTDAGAQAASGIYFYRLERAEQTNTRKMVLLK
jgi:hypothetical protein